MRRAPAARFPRCRSHRPKLAVRCPVHGREPANPSAQRRGQSSAPQCRRRRSRPCASCRKRQRDIESPDGVIGGIGVEHFQIVEVTLRFDEIRAGMPGAELKLDEAIGWDAKRPDIREPWPRDAGGGDGDQPQLAIGCAKTLRDPIVPRHDLEEEATLIEPHDVKPRYSTRQVERDITGRVTAGKRRADFTKRGKCLGSELCDGNAVHPGRSLDNFEKKSPDSRRIRASWNCAILSTHRPHHSRLVVSVCTPHPWAACSSSSSGSAYCGRNGWGLASNVWTWQSPGPSLKISWFRNGGSATRSQGPSRMSQLSPPSQQRTRHSPSRMKKTSS